MSDTPKQARSVLRCHKCRRLAAFKADGRLRPACKMTTVVTSDESGVVRVLCLRCRVLVEEQT